MKILALSDLYPPFYKGGHEIQVKFFVEELKRADYKVFVLTGDYLGRKITREPHIYRVLKYIDVTASNKLIGKYKQLIYAILGRINYFKTKNIIKKINPDIVYAGQVRGISIFPLKAIQKYYLPIVHHLGTTHYVGLYYDCFYRKNPIKRLYAKLIAGVFTRNTIDFKHLITVSKALKNEYEKVGFQSNSISIIPPIGISEKLIKQNIYEEKSPTKNELKLLYVGRICEEKGVHNAILAVGHLINKLNYRNITFDMVGKCEGTYFNRLKQLARSLKIENNLNFIGKMNHERLFEIYKQYKYFLFPSLFDSFPIVLLEALSQGLSVVATNIGGIPEIIINEWNGLLVPPNEPVEMAESIERLIENPELYEKIVKNAIETIKSKYTTGIVMSKITKYFELAYNESKN